MVTCLHFVLKLKVCKILTFSIFSISNLKISEPEPVTETEPVPVTDEAPVTEPVTEQVTEQLPNTTTSEKLPSDLTASSTQLISF